MTKIRTSFILQNIEFFFAIIQRVRMTIHELIFCTCKYVHCIPEILIVWNNPFEKISRKSDLHCCPFHLFRRALQYSIKHTVSFNWNTVIANQLQLKIILCALVYKLIESITINLIDSYGFIHIKSSGNPKIKVLRTFNQWNHD